MRGARALAVVVVLAAAVSAGAPAERAEAASLDGACNAGEWCVFKDSNFRGCVLDYDGAIGGDISDDDYPGCRGQKVNDSVSSYRNGSDLWLVMAEHHNGDGFLYCVAPKASGNVLRRFNDKASQIGAVDADTFREHIERDCNHVDRD